MQLTVVWTLSVFMQLLHFHDHFYCCDQDIWIIVKYAFLALQRWMCCHLQLTSNTGHQEVQHRVNSLK